PAPSNLPLIQQSINPLLQCPARLCVEMNPPTTNPLPLAIPLHINLHQLQMGLGCPCRNDLTVRHTKRKEIIMQTAKLPIPDPVRARAYFENKVTFTTGPVELDRMIKSGENNLVIV